jgi:hypothetical protein
MMQLFWFANPTICTEEKGNAYKILVGKAEGKSLLGRSRYRWKDNIKIDLKGIGWEGVNWSHVAQDGDW